MEELNWWAHQSRAIARSANPQDPCFDNMALFFETGTGKTATTVRVIADKFNRAKRVMRTVIVCPIIVTENWPREITKYSKITRDKVFVTYNKNPKKRYDNLAKALKNNNGNMIIVVNFEGTLDKKLMDMLLAWKPEILVVDESQRCKNPQAKRTKNTITIADLTDHRYILSGTPILNSPMDVWSQYRILDKGSRFGRNFFSFRAKFFYDKNAGMPAHLHFPDWAPRGAIYKDGKIIGFEPGSPMEEMNRLIYEIAEQAIKSECLDLPPLVRQSIYVDLSPEQRRLYDDLKENFVAYVSENPDDGAVVTDLAITKALRLQQIVSGYVKLEDGREIFFEDTPRRSALKELLEDIVCVNKKKVIVWSVFKHNYKIIADVCKELGIKYLEAHGEVSAKKKLENVDLFNENEEYGVFIGHPASLGVGINLVAASYSIYYSRDFSLENDLQSEARNYRGGSEIHESITRIDLIAKDTMDEQTVEALANKMAISSKVLKKWKEKI
jgi:SNF2 family DNA or RNA helicase